MPMSKNKSIIWLEMTALQVTQDQAIYTDPITILPTMKGCPTQLLNLSDVPGYHDGPDGQNILS